MDNLNKIARLFGLFNKVKLNHTSNFVNTPCTRNFTVTAVKRDLMEFFDDKKNWGVDEVKCGRSWTKDELRLKSNEDLHKLWYVLLKERNMLMTMEQECNDKAKLFPTPERIDKVADSMENLESVVRERNKAYHQLETGETGERPGKVQTGVFGLKYYYKMTEHVMPKYMNTKWRESHKFYKYKYDKDVEDFLLKYREKLYLSKRKKATRDFNHVLGLLNRYPDLDMEALKEQYPDVDIERVKRSRKYGGHFTPK
ncbi:39S ribosomal protein L47, mitochondrial [Diabrotica virgifera virgifera]|uniref:Large ribosomal subunit protein uL29m n=1 Tax=Diabrotica virgifera virgifera TaxID=50390 RepID=A0A6P7EZD3_DIAVI|nr:39S ribosomal protein L47, mitochondrial [Diabrotica virgifera virgifera]